MAANVSGPDAVFTHWAILIGVSLEYNGHQRPLKGPPADIAAMKDYLSTEPHVKITTLTSTAPHLSEESSSSNPVRPVEDPEHLATVDNVHAVLESAIKQGREGNVKQVYIHFSGHGARVGRDQLLGLILYHALAKKDRPSCLQSKDLSRKLQKMSQIGIRVTLVLDCCFSGSVKRGQESADLNDIRYLECDAFLEEAYQNSLLEEHSDAPPMRQGRVQMHNDLDPEDYVVITACTSTQTAIDARFNGQTARGALSYFLNCSLRWLRDAGTEITGETLFRHLAAVFHAEYPEQTPLRYGNFDICFFKNLFGGPRQPYTSVFRSKQSETIVLDAGEAHGVHVGDEYRAYPYSSSESDHNSERDSAVILRVSRVHGLNSDLAIVSSSRVERLSGLHTWKAELSLSSSTQKIRIHLADNLSHDVQEALRLELASYPFIELVSGHAEHVSCVFTLQISNKPDYEILGSAGEKGLTNPVPTTRCDSEGSLISVVATLRHLTAFKFFEGLQNRRPDPAFTSSFALEVVTHTTAHDGFFDVVHGDTWTLKISNTSSSPLYLTVFEFQESWEVSNLVSDAGGGDHLEVAPKATMELPIDMTVPDDFIHAGQAIDIVKVFVTSRATHFPRVILPRLGESHLRDDASRDYEDLRNWTNGFTSMRSGSGDRWITQNFPIRTRMGG